MPKLKPDGSYYSSLSVAQQRILLSLLDTGG